MFSMYDVGIQLHKHKGTTIMSNDGFQLHNHKVIIITSNIGIYFKHPLLVLSYLKLHPI